MFKIKITRNGPYAVKGDVKLVEETSKDVHGVLCAVKTKAFEPQEEYYLCRCGKSKQKPFCDGTHEEVRFDGTETASKKPYLERAEIIYGETVNLADDHRCSYARYCHRRLGDVWGLTKASDDSELKAEAVEGACACPSGRLTSIEDGKLIEKKYAPTVAIVQDPLVGVSAGISLRGDFELEGADGSAYEKRNRASLCRCGKSKNKPFCDGTHVNVNFTDK